jgi:hypothetical protein|tara:strand:- start:231 stop:2264 length:2034 start_codon:yes stop_codon:yes gene_type:complete
MHFDTLAEFFTFLTSTVEADANIEDSQQFIEDSFTEYMIDVLHDAEELENCIQIVPGYKSRGVKVNGYDINSQENQLDLVVTYYSHEKEKIPTLPQTQLEKVFKRGKSFFSRCRSGIQGLEESMDVFDLSKRITSLFHNLKRIRIIVITNCTTGNLPAVVEDDNDLEYTYLTWDVERVFRFVNSGKIAQPVNINFLEEFGRPLQCVFKQDYNSVYTTYTGFLSAEMLYQLYDRWGPRLLERNVRAYLQARSKVNKGIRDTIIEVPNLFLAFNNGLTITADSIKKKNNGDLSCSITEINDFQIVNGGQTCASLWHTKEKQNADLSKINVMMKLSVFNDKDDIKKMAPLISRFSNSQNPVNQADFSANDPYHVKLAKIGERIYAPDPTGGGKQTFWFYERARGLFDETRNRQRTRKKIRNWDALHPRKQRFDKLLLAKSENTWTMKPDIVSMGAQKNFKDYTVTLRENGIQEISDSEYKKLIARIILWKNMERIVSNQQKPGYRANIVTYTLAWFFHLSERRITLDEIWDNQKMDADLISILDEMAFKVRDHITGTQYNVTEWCKKYECWKKLLKKRYTLPDNYQNKLIDTAPESEVLSDSSKENIETCMKVAPDTWASLSRWASLTGSLEGWQRGIAYSIGKRMAIGKEPTRKQAYHGVDIYDKAIKLGFKPDKDYKK